jgi:hypothetical protein
MGDTPHARLLDMYLRLPSDDPATTLTFIVNHREALLTHEAEAAVGNHLRHTQDKADQSRLRELVELIQQLRQATEAMAEMRPEERLFFAFASTPNRQALEQFVTQLGEYELHQLETIARQKVAELQAQGQDGDAEKLQQRLNDLQQIYRQMASLSALDKILLAWFRTPDWDSSQTFLATHIEELMTDEAAARLAKLLADQPGDPMLREHQQLLAMSRTEGIKAAYATFIKQRRQLQEREVTEQDDRLSLALTRFATIENDADARAILQQESALLLTWEAGNMLRQLIELAVQSENKAVADRLRIRYAQWQDEL